MTAHNRFTEVASGMFKGIFDISMAIVVGLILFSIVLLGFWYFFKYRRKFDILVKIRSERANDPSIYFDKGAILKDKEGNKYFKLLKTNVILSAPNFKVIESTNKGDYLELWRKSEDDFVFLTKPSIDKEKVVRLDGKSYPIARTKQRQIEGDYYFIVKRRQDNKKMFDPESLLMKVLAFAPQIISLVITFMLLWIILDKAPDIVNQVNTLVNEMRELTRELQSLKGAATI